MQWTRLVIQNEDLSAVDYFNNCDTSNTTIYVCNSRKNHLQVKLFGFDFNVATAFMVLVAGAMMVSWMADMTTKYGVGGAGVMIMPGIFISMPMMVMHGPVRAAS